ncbi:unnamed protein product, partial [Cyprideis torosa]
CSRHSLLLFYDKGERPYQCQLCPSAFAQSGTLKISSEEPHGGNPVRMRLVFVLDTAFGPKPDSRLFIFRLKTYLVLCAGQ